MLGHYRRWRADGGPLVYANRGWTDHDFNKCMQNGLYDYFYLLVNILVGALYNSHYVYSYLGPLP